MKNLTSQIENVFLEYMSELQGDPIEEQRNRYLRLKRDFKPHSNRFRHISEEFIRLHDFFFHIDHNSDYLKLNQHHAYIGVIRLLSYSVSRPSMLSNLNYFIKLSMHGELKRALCSLRRELLKRMRNNPEPDILHLARERFQRVVLLDYGAGLAYQTVEMASQLGNSLECLVLVDIPSIISDFACYRVKKAKIPFERIKVTSDDPYPRLPPHHICVANEVVEHIKNPLTLLDRVATAQESGAYLYGDFNDHCPELYHLHTDLGFFREALEKTHQSVGGDWYIKS